jgi:hypothetical protein
MAPGSKPPGLADLALRGGNSLSIMLSGKPLLTALAWKNCAPLNIIGHSTLNHRQRQQLKPATPAPLSGR